ncbi:MAG TPA: cation transporter [Lentisphaeria bacterium]|nr:cation transporter [Lentisphaeria bacterium]
MSELPETDSKSKEAALKGLFIAGLLDAIITSVAFIMANSSVLLADFLKTSIELLAIFLSWMAMRRINRGDKSFEYGLGKLENMLSIFVGFVMFVSFVIIMVNAIRNIFHPGHIAGIGVWISVGAQSLYLVINGSLYVKNKKLAKSSSSPLMDSQTRLFLTRFIGNLFILISLALSLLLKKYSWSVYIDPAASMIIAFSILSAILGIFSSSIYDLLDRTLEEERQILILQELVGFFDDYQQVHGIRSRRSGSKVYIEIFLEFSPEKTVAEVQKVIDKLRGNLEKKIQGSSVTIGLTTEAVK